MSTDNTQKPSKHLDSLTVKNFRVLEDVEIEKLGHVNLIVGKNNSGKSTVLEALALLASGFHKDVVKKIVIDRDFGNHTSLFINHIKKYGMYKLFDDLLPINHMKSFPPKIFIGDNKISLTLEKTTTDIPNNNESKKKNKIGYEKVVMPLIQSTKLIDEMTSGIELVLKVDSSFNDIRKVPFDDSNFLLSEKIDFLQKSVPLGYVKSCFQFSSELIEEWDKVLLTDLECVVIEILQIIEPMIEKIAFINNSNNIQIPYVKLKNVDDKLPLSSMGEGLTRLLYIILRMLKAKYGFLLIDEFENGLHYSVQPKVWRLIFDLAKKFNIQVFATTHSWDCIESFAQVAKEREDLDGILFRMGRSVRKSDKGKVIATVYDEDKLYNLTKSNIEVR